MKRKEPEGGKALLDRSMAISEGEGNGRCQYPVRRTVICFFIGVGLVSCLLACQQCSARFADSPFAAFGAAMASDTEGSKTDASLGVTPMYLCAGLLCPDTCTLERSSSEQGIYELTSTLQGSAFATSLEDSLYASGWESVEMDGAAANAGYGYLSATRSGQADSGVPRFVFVQWECIDEGSLVLFRCIY
jgi:hypothetical protein